MKWDFRKSLLFRAAGIIGIFGLGAAVGILGAYQYTKANISSSHVVNQKETDKLITDKIAIVNLDEGAIVNEDVVNYAGKLLTDLGDNFLFTGLEDARQGYATGIYAGYLVVPATFSESVVSLNDTPIRAEITYAINDQLDGDVKEEVIYDVLGVISDLNNRISYMYLYSIMDEFHDAQDKSDVVMNNDLEEKEAINAVQANDLIALVPVTDLTEVDYNVESLDISEYMSTNAELTGQIGTKYNEYLLESETDHQKLNEEATALMAEMGNMDGVINGIDLTHDSEGNLVYQTGVDELSALFEAHNTALMEKETDINNNVLKIYGDVQTYLYEYNQAKAAYQKENENKYLNTLNALEELFGEYRENYVLISSYEIQQLKEVIEQQNNQIIQQQAIMDSIQEESGEEGDTTEREEAAGGEEASMEGGGIQMFSVDGEGVNKLSELQQKMQTVLEANYYVFSGYAVDENGVAKVDEEGNYIELQSYLAEYNQNLDDQEIKNEILSKQVGEIEKMSIDEAESIVEEGVLTPIQDNTNKITETILNQYAIEKEQLGEYSEAVMNYDPLKYINQEEIQNLTSAMFDNGSKMAEAILETDLQQMEYVAEVYDTSRNDLNNLQDSIITAKEDSDKAVEEGLQHLQDIKNENSNENQLILYDFSRKLPYTRLGSLEYTQAYEFMANPIGTLQMQENKNSLTSSDSVRSGSDSVNVQLNNKNDYEKIVVLICVMICVIIVVSTIKYHFHKKEESMEG